MVKSRDFVNLRSWQLFVNGKILENYELNTETLSPIIEDSDEFEDSIDNESSLTTASVRTTGWEVGIKPSNSLSHIGSARSRDPVFTSLSKSLGAKHFSSYEVENFTAPEAAAPQQQQQSLGATKTDTTTLNVGDEDKSERVYLTSAVSIDYASVAINSKCIRGQNIISCFAFREIENKTNECIFEWLLCLDLKGYIPKYVLDSSYSTFMQEYMSFLRNHIAELSSQNEPSPTN